MMESTVGGNTAGAGGTGGLGSAGAGSGGGGGSGGSGGGIVSVTGALGSGFLLLTNVTVSGNTVGTGGAGAQGSPPGAGGSGGAAGGVATRTDTRLYNVTIAGNLGGGIGDGLVAVGAVSEYGSVIADNGLPGFAQNCTGTIANAGADVTYPSENASNCPGVVADPKLGPLALHGGAIPTIALGAGSAAIDAEPAGAPCPDTDERGVPRPQRSACDAGAYENAPPAISHIRASATGPTTATVSADIDAHLQTTTYSVHFGTSAAYGSSSQTAQAGPAAGAVHASVPLAGLTPGTTDHLALIATNADGTTSSTDLAVTLPDSGGRGGGVPVVSNARQSARRWRVGRALATLTRTRRPPIGTTFAFDLNEAAKVTLTFTRRAAGRLVTGRCVKPVRRNRRRPRCTRGVPAGGLAFDGFPGTNRIHFFGRLSRRARLASGSYAVAITAVNPTNQRSSPARLRFVIVTSSPCRDGARRGCGSTASRRPGRAPPRRSSPRRTGLARSRGY